MTPKIVYVVDDDLGMLESTQWLLESVDLQVKTFNNGQQFLQALIPEEAGCLILDIRMPGMGGLNVQEALQKQHIELPIIFVSGHADVPIVVRAFKSGAIDFIEKPCSQQLLLDSVQHALQQSYAAASRATVGNGQALLNTLTKREQDVFLPLAQGYSSREMAEQLNVGIKTIDLYRARVMKKLGAERLPDVTALAIQHGLLSVTQLRPDTNEY